MCLPSPAYSQICGVPLRCSGRGQLGAVLRSGRPVDTERLPGSHSGYGGHRPSEARADWLLLAAGRQRSAGSQCGAGPLDGHRQVATPLRGKKNQSEPGLVVTDC